MPPARPTTMALPGRSSLRPWPLRCWPTPFEAALVARSCRRRLAPLLSPPNAARAATSGRTGAAEARSGIFDPLLLVFARRSLSGQMVTRPRRRESGGDALEGGRRVAMLLSVR